MFQGDYFRKGSGDNAVSLSEAVRLIVPRGNSITIEQRPSWNEGTAQSAVHDRQSRDVDVLVRRLQTDTMPCREGIRTSWLVPLSRGVRTIVTQY